MEKNSYIYTLSKVSYLDTPLRQEDIVRLIACPHFFELLYHGLVRFYKHDGKKFSPDEQLKEGDEFCAHQPDMEGKELNTYRLNKLQISEGNGEMVVENIEASSKAPFPQALMTLKYSTKGNENKVEILFECNTKDETALTLMKIVFDHSLLRLQRLANDPEKTLNELALITDLDFKILDETTLSKLPYGITTELKLDQPIDKRYLNNPSLLRKIFPNTIQTMLQNQDSISTNDTCTIKIKNMSTLGKVFDEEVTFTVQKCDDELIMFSNTRVTHLHQLGVKLQLNSDGNNSSITISIYYGSSKLINFAKGILAIASYVSSKAPDLDIVLKLRTRNMLEASVRLIHNYLNGAEHELKNENIKKLTY